MGRIDSKPRSTLPTACAAFLLGMLVVSFFRGRQTHETTQQQQARYTGAGPLFDDEIFLGAQEGDDPPERLDSYQYNAMPYQHVYDKSWMEGGYPRQSCWGCRFTADVLARVKVHTVLDAGTGNGAMVRLLRSHGKSAWGIELSHAVLEAECPDLLQAGIVEAGSITNLPYKTNQFDLVMSADVLEHLQPQDADQVVRELIRVSRRHIFLSISLKGHTRQSDKDQTEAGRHTLLRPREWWEAKFREHGAVVNEELVWALQERDAHYRKDELQKCQWEGGNDDGGLYEVCVVRNTWLVGDREQANVRRDRCVTTSNWELEPWFFAFRVLR